MTQYFSTIIEILEGKSPVKYEFDKINNRLIVDRFLKSSMLYPANYGFIPNTLGQDGDPIDVLLISYCELFPGVEIESRAIGVLNMEDESGQDEKIIAVPSPNITDYYDNIDSLSDLPKQLIESIRYFFERYKDLDKNKWAKVGNWGTFDEANAIISQSYLK